MKSIICIALIICVNEICAQVLKPVAFYYVGGEKIYLYENKKDIVLIFKDNSSYKNNETTFSWDKSIVEMDVSDGTEDINFARLTFSSEIDNILRKLQDYNIYNDDLEMFSYGFMSLERKRIWVTNEVLFKLKPEFTIEDFKEILDFYNALFFEEVDRFGTYSFKVFNISNVFDLASDLYESNKVIFSTPDFSQEIGLEQLDSLYNQQYYLHNVGQTIDGVPSTPDMDIDAPHAWEITKGNPNIRVAVIDDGVEISPAHEDLVGRVIHGWTPGCLINCDGSPRGNLSHGQAVAGIIAANHNNIGVSGIAPNITIVPFRIFRKYGSTKTSKNIGKAITAAWDDFNCDILSNSWKLRFPSDYVTNAINNAVTKGRNGLGSIVVFAGGNSGPSNNTVSYPANLGNVIAVSALNKFGQIVEYSSRGTEIDIAAFGGGCRNCSTPPDIRTTDRMGDFGYTNVNYMDTFNGTSAAAPQVAAVAALMLSVNPNLTAWEVYCRLTMTASDLGDPGRDNDYGYGLLNAYRAIAFDSLHIANKTFGGVQKFTAANTVTIGPSVVFENTGHWLSNIEVVAGNKIVAKPGSRSEQGSYFRARISDDGPCGFGPKNMQHDNNDDPTPPVVLAKTSIEKKEEISTIKTYFQIHPNPFSSYTQIVFSLPQPTDVKIYITNLYGQKILPVHSGKTQEGEHSIHVNTSSLPEGIYFCILQTPTHRKVLKLIKI